MANYTILLDGEEIQSPEFLSELSLKPRLAWLYRSVFDEIPYIVSNFADCVISSYSRKYINSPDIDLLSVLFRDAVLSQKLYKDMLEEMHTLGKYGVRYTLFRTPACFYIPYIITEKMSIAIPPYTYQMRKLVKALTKY